LLAVYCLSPLPCYADGWEALYGFDWSVGLSAPKGYNNWIEVLKYGRSLGSSGVLGHLGVSADLGEYYSLLDSTKACESLFPVYLHYVPWMRVHRTPIHPIVRQEQHYGYTDIYYTSKAVDVPTLTMIDLYVGGSAWATRGDEHGFGDRWYLRCACRLNRTVTINKDAPGDYGVATFAVEVGATAFPSIDRRVVQCRPYLVFIWGWVGPKPL
jgi:hypothetical protein